MKNKIVWPGSTQLAPVPVVLVGCGNGDDIPYNLITVAWAGTVCSDPAMLSVSIRPERHSYDIMMKTREFTVNLPSRKLARSVDFCGVVSGRDCDKFAETGLTPTTVNGTPIIAEAKLVLICKKLYADDIKRENFISDEPLYTYEKNDFHRFYICEIEKALLKVDN